VLTGPGSCGAFLKLGNGVPIRPVGFCNVNEMFEINTEQADSVEVLRGPSNSLYGSSAVHGAVNVLQAAPADRSKLRGGVDARSGSISPDQARRARSATARRRAWPRSMRTTAAGAQARDSTRGS
jgi:iron complex outermembrane receptor protein